MGRRLKGLRNVAGLSCLFLDMNSTISKFCIICNRLRLVLMCKNLVYFGPPPLPYNYPSFALAAALIETNIVDLGIYSLNHLRAIIILKNVQKTSLLFHKFQSCFVLLEIFNTEVFTFFTTLM